MSAHELLEALVVLFLCAVALGWAARQMRVPYPIALVLGGALLGLIPGLPAVPLEPGLILFIVLPPVLYQTALFTSWRDFRRHLRAIPCWPLDWCSRPPSLWPSRSIF